MGYMALCRDYLAKHRTFNEFQTIGPVHKRFISVESGERSSPPSTARSKQRMRLPPKWERIAVLKEPVVSMQSTKVMPKKRTWCAYQS